MDSRTGIRCISSFGKLVAIPDTEFCAIQTNTIFGHREIGEMLGSLPFFTSTVEDFERSGRHTIYIPISAKYKDNVCEWIRSRQPGLVFEVCSARLS
jgi:hypothetical protein